MNRGEPWDVECYRTSAEAKRRKAAKLIVCAVRLRAAAAELEGMAAMVEAHPYSETKKLIRQQQAEREQIAATEIERTLEEMKKR